MSGSGIGRGRGWLKINTNQEAKNPVIAGIQSVTVPLENAAKYDDFEVSNGAPVAKFHSKYTGLIEQFMSFDENDDEDTRSRKLSMAKIVFKTCCQKAEDTTEAMEVLYEQCLHNEELTKRVLLVIFEIKLEVHGVNVKLPFITRMQKDSERYTEDKNLHLGNLKVFRNVVRFHGGFLQHLTLPVRDIRYSMVGSLLAFLERLLMTSDDTNMQLVTVQLFCNGVTMKDMQPQELGALLILIRKTLSLSDKLSRTGRLWLLLSLDISNHKYGLLPTELQQFYISQLGDDAMSQFKKAPSLSVQTNYHNTFDNVQSNVGVLQVNNALTNCDINKPDNETPEPQSSIDHNPVPSGMNNIGTWEQTRPEKTPRPILGAGSKLKGLENYDSRDWGKNSKVNATGWGEQPKKNHFIKGWEHDDRFAKDY